MTWGGLQQTGVDMASQAAQQQAMKALSSAPEAAQVVNRVAQAQQAVGMAQKLAQGVGNTAGFAAQSVADGVKTAGGLAASAVAAPFKAAKSVMSPSKPAGGSPVEPCPLSNEAKKARLEKRNQLIEEGRHSGEPAKVAAADRLAQDNQAVELARLSENSYAQYPNNDFKYPDGSVAAPPGWSVVPKEELEAKGMSIKDFEKARAVAYRTPEDWPGGQKTVIAFRGTADLEDAIVDHDQAMALETDQYKASERLGEMAQKRMGNDLLVTGHSLGGGKAQAAGAAGGFQGMMFNSAGLHPDTVGGNMPSPVQFIQYRTTGDPLTGAQNNAAVQTAILGIVGPLGVVGGGVVKLADGAMKLVGLDGLSKQTTDYADKAFKALPRAMRNVFETGRALPPAVGPVHEVKALDAQGEEYSKLNLLKQHSITSAVNGIEAEKTQDVATLSS